MLDQPFLQIVQGAAPERALIGRQPDKGGVSRHALGELIAGEAFPATEGFGHDLDAFCLGFLLEEDHVGFSFAKSERGLGLLFGRLQVALGHGQAWSGCSA